MAPYSPRAAAFVRCVSKPDHPCLRVAAPSLDRPHQGRTHAAATLRCRHDQLLHVDVDAASVVRPAALVALERCVHETDHGATAHRHEDCPVYLRDPRLVPALDFTRVRDVAEGRLAGHNFGSDLQVEPGRSP